MSDDPRKYIMVYTRLSYEINMTLGAGTSLLVRNTAEEFDVSHGTVHKAFKMLEEDGLIKYYQGIGWIVT
jgi:DNA-binding GntR family transcriptional regulator